jgi:hypothetical protein
VRLDELKSAVHKCSRSFQESNKHFFMFNREVGGAMMEFYDKCVPKMEEYDVNVRVDVVGNMVIIGTQSNFQDLSMERHFLRFRNAVTVKVRQCLESIIPSYHC